MDKYKFTNEEIILINDALGLKKKEYEDAFERQEFTKIQFSKAGMVELVKTPVTEVEIAELKKTLYYQLLHSTLEKTNKIVTLLLEHPEYQNFITNL
jgi:hypothetical protein